MNRLRSEYKEAMKNAAAGDGTMLLSVRDESNLFRWNGVIKGPPDSPYFGGTFQLRIEVPQNYPLSPPTITFVTKIFHPNVNFRTGEICLDILKEAWTPVWSLSSSLLAIVALLSHPEASSPLNCDAGNLIRAGDILGFESMARMYTIEHAK